MGISDVKSALQRTAGSNYSISNVQLSYLDGGRQQQIQFKCRNQSLGTTTDKLHVIGGGENPVEAAARIGGGLAAEGED